jgi:hypothetical protein
MVRNDLEATLSDLGKQLGLSPGARLRAGIAHQAPVDEQARKARGEAVIAEYKRRLGVS